MLRRTPQWRAALWYAERGIHVFPLQPRTKRPLLRGGAGHHDATTDLAAIEGWWRRVPTANIGISCAASSLVAVDVDTYRYGDEALGAFEAQHGSSPRTWEALARGRHLYFRTARDAKFRGHLTTPDCGVELKSNGYTAAPPSVHPTGILYTWDVGAHPLDIPLADLPAAWLRALTVGTKGPARAGVGSARDAFLGEAFAACGWVGAELRSGAVCVRCPWWELHSDGRGQGDDSSAVVLAPTSSVRVGRFVCAHAHCASRTLADVITQLPPAAIDSAARRYPKAFACVVSRLARERVRVRA